MIRVALSDHISQTPNIHHHFVNRLEGDHKMIKDTPPYFCSTEWLPPDETEPLTLDWRFDEGIVEITHQPHQAGYIGLIRTIFEPNPLTEAKKRLVADLEALIGQEVDDPLKRAILWRMGALDAEFKLRSPEAWYG